MNLTFEELARIKESLPTDTLVQAIVCGTKYKDAIKNIMINPMGKELPTLSVFGMRVFDLIEMDSYDRTLVFNDLQDAIGFVRVIDALRDYSEVETAKKVIDVFMSKANTLDSKESK